MHWYGTQNLHNSDLNLIGFFRRSPIQPRPIEIYGKTGAIHTRTWSDFSSVLQQKPIDGGNQPVSKLTFLATSGRSTVCYKKRRPNFFGVSNKPLAYETCELVRKRQFVQFKHALAGISSPISCLGRH